MRIFLKILIISFIFSNCVKADNGMPKVYYRLTGDIAKSYFFNFFANKINLENEKILNERVFILSLEDKKDLDEESLEYKKLKELQIKYKVQDIYDYETFLKRVDVIPPSLAIAQAAVESAWGKSRFIKVANNIFGHWTYNPEIGIVPLDRIEGKQHLIRVFKTLQDSIAAYMLNLNRTSAYQNFRDERKNMRDNKEFIDGLKLSKTMDKYSGIGHDYVKILSLIIKKYELNNFDKIFYNKLKGKQQWNSLHR